MNVLIVDLDLGEVISPAAGPEGYRGTAQFDRAREHGAVRSLDAASCDEHVIGS
jgi:hypothetical protein